MYKTMEISEEGSLKMAGLDIKEIGEKYGTPLYLLDQEEIESKIKLFKTCIKSNEYKSEIIYASKAFLSMEMCKILKEEKLSIDVVSIGELYIVKKSGFPMNRVYFHGNNKSTEEIEFAIENNVRIIVVDNINELKNIKKINKNYKKKINVYFRLNIGLKVDTHKYLVTSHNESKFGFNINGEDIKSCFKLVKNDEFINLIGFHSHLGSQIKNTEAYISQISFLYDYILKINKSGFNIKELNIGGGFPVRENLNQEKIDLESLLISIRTCLEKKIKEEKQDIKLLLEPGRSIISNAGITLYEIGGVKKIDENKDYIFINGGMTDNIRPSLYNSEYSFEVLSKILRPKTNTYIVAGKYCESGDILSKEIKLPVVNKGDYLVSFNTGAYNFSMFSNYNGALRPAVVFLKKGVCKLGVKRQTLEEIVV